MSAAFELLYEDGPCLAVRKPPGLATQAPMGIESLETQVKQFLKVREGIAGNVYLGVPHRLDRPVSGVVVLARHERAARRLSWQFEHRRVRKLYWACVEGTVSPEQGTWRDHLIKVYGRPCAEVAPEGHPQARLALLHYRVRGQTPFGSWLQIELETGRTHQVRIQAASRGWPVLGDAQYGARLPFGPQHADERLRAIALHGRSISFRHPMTRQPITVVAPLSAE